jgi:copper chaperone
MALKGADAGAKVQIDLANHRVQVEPAEADAEELADAIREAGYTPMPVTAATVSAPKAGGCCGCR